MKQIIAIGGGGFGREIGELKIEKYIVKQSINQNQRFVYSNTSVDDQGYIDNFYKAFDSLRICITSHIDFFKRTIDLESHISN